MRYPRADTHVQTGQTGPQREGHSRGSPEYPPPETEQTRKGQTQPDDTRPHVTTQARATQTQWYSSPFGSPHASHS
eukprot:478608-Prymnesium_polylepis.1